MTLKGDMETCTDPEKASELLNTAPPTVKPGHLSLCCFERLPFGVAAV